MAAIAIPISAMLLPHTPYSAWLLAVIVIVPTIVVVKHHQNIARLVRGTEYRFGKTGTTAA
jgi:glycerol-3-phosphate acyltransferase PlsY